MVDRGPGPSPAIEPVSVLIVEDDFRIAEIHRSFVLSAEGARVVGSLRTGRETMDWLAVPGNHADLILLDVYLPDVEGLDLLWQLRNTHKDLDIVMVTAACEADVIEETLRGGVVDYLIKPTDAERVRAMISRYLAKRALLRDGRAVRQDELDRTLRGSVVDAARRTRTLPKGIDELTLGAIAEALQSRRTPATASDLGAAIGASRSTARRYLEFMVADGRAIAELTYGDVGRPQRLYRSVGAA